MSIRSRATRSLSPRKLLVTTAITAVAALGLVIAAPGSDAFAAGPTSPQERVAFSIEHGHFLDDVHAGRISDADITAVGKTGLDVNGQHIDKWLDLTPEQEAAQTKAAATLRAEVDADPTSKASIESLRSAQSDDQVAAAFNDDNTATTATSTQPAPLAGDSPVTESKHWWNHIPIHIHITPIHIHPHIHIDHPSFHLGNALVRAIITAAATAVVGLICAAFPDITKVTCVIMATFAGALAEFVKSKGICGGHGVWMELFPKFGLHC